MKSPAPFFGLLFQSLCLISLIAPLAGFSQEGEPLSLKKVATISAAKLYSKEIATVGGLQWLRDGRLLIGRTPPYGFASDPGEEDHLQTESIYIPDTAYWYPVKVGPQKAGAAKGTEIKTLGETLTELKTWTVAPQPGLPTHKQAASQWVYRQEAKWKKLEMPGYDVDQLVVSEDGLHALLCVYSLEDPGLATVVLWNRVADTDEWEKVLPAEEEAKDKPEDVSFGYWAESYLNGSIFSPDGRFVAITMQPNGYDGPAMWHVIDLQNRTEVDFGLAEDKALHAVAFDTGDKQIAISTDDGEVQVLKIAAE